MAILRCIEAFTYWNTEGHPVSIAPGDLVEDKDAAVKGREHLFETVEANVERRTSRVEQATAAPGETRNAAKAAKASKAVES